MVLSNECEALDAAKPAYSVNNVMDTTNAMARKELQACISEHGSWAQECADERKAWLETTSEWLSNDGLQDDEEVPDDLAPCCEEPGESMTNPNDQPVRAARECMDEMAELFNDSGRPVGDPEAPDLGDPMLGCFPASTLVQTCGLDMVATPAPGSGSSLCIDEPIPTLDLIGLQELFTDPEPPFDQLPEQVVSTMKMAVKTIGVQ